MLAVQTLEKEEGEGRGEGVRAGSLRTRTKLTLNMKEQNEVLKKCCTQRVRIYDEFIKEREIIQLLLINSANGSRNLKIRDHENNERCAYR